MLLSDGKPVVEGPVSQTILVGNVPASGKKVEVTGINVYRIANGKIVETWANMDFLGVLQQVGAMPAPG